MSFLPDAHFFSDETGSHTGGRLFIVAGVALGPYRNWNRHDLLHAEKVSMKGKADWHATKNPARRIKYIQVILNTLGVEGRVFYGEFRGTTKQHYWRHTVETLAAAIERFADGHKAIIHHQGFNSGSRDRLRKDLRDRGHSVIVRSADQSMRPETRLADALCGYLGICCDDQHNKACDFPAKPDWFVQVNALPQAD